jgi:hypothetical protein
MIKEYLDETEFYLIKDEIKFHCDEQQFIYVCKEHGETMGCYFCEFNYDENCEEQH